LKYCKGRVQEKAQPLVEANPNRENLEVYPDNNRNYYNNIDDVA